MTTNSQKTSYDENNPILSFRIDKKTYDRLKNYADASRRPIKEIVLKSLNSHLDNIDGIIHELSEPPIEPTNVNRLKQFFGVSGVNQDQEVNSFINELDTIADSINKIKLIFKRKENK